MLLLIPGGAWGQTPTITNPDTVFTLKSDSTWKFARNPQNGWEKPSFDDSGWGYTMAPSRGLCAGKIDNFEGDPMWAPNPINQETVYFRKTFMLSDAPKSALVKVVMDDDGEVYVNGVMVLQSIDGVVGVSQGYFASQFKKGPNTIALVVRDSYGVCQSAAVYIETKLPYAEKYELDIPHMKQSTLTWAPLQYAGGLQDKMLCGIAIGNCGCVITSLAMMLSFHGVLKGPDGLNTTPDVLNEYFSRNQECDENGCVSDGYVYGDVIWGALHQYTKKANERFNSPKVMFVGGGAYNRELTAADIKSDKPVILKAPEKSHWFVASGINGATFSIKDPLFEWSTLDNPDYKNTAAEMRRFTKVHSDFSALEIFAKAPEHILATAPDGKRVGYDPTTKATLYEIPGAVYLEDDNSTIVRHIVIPLPKKGAYEVRIVSPDQESSHQYIVVQTNRGAENKRIVGKDDGNPIVIDVDPDFVLQPSITPSSMPTQVFIEPTKQINKMHDEEICRGGENRTPTARTPCAHSTIILLPVGHYYFAPACYDLQKLTDRYKLRRPSLFFSTDYSIIN